MFRKEDITWIIYSDPKAKFIEIEVLSLKTLKTIGKINVPWKDSSKGVLEETVGGTLVSQEEQITSASSVS